MVQFRLRSNIVLFVLTIFNEGAYLSQSIVHKDLKDGIFLYLLFVFMVLISAWRIIHQATCPVLRWFIVTEGFSGAQSFDLEVPARSTLPTSHLTIR